MKEADSTPVPVSWGTLVLENLLEVSVLLVFVAAIVGVVVRRRQRDKCLKLLWDHHVTYLTKKGAAIWGDLQVYPQGLEIQYDEEHISPKGLKKTSSLIYENELEDLLSLSRVDLALTQEEREERIEQVKKTFNPNFIYRTSRVIRNTFNTLKDALSQAVTKIMSSISKTKPGAKEVGSKESIDIGQNLVSSVGNAYEPMLEKHIGKSVVLRLKSPENENEILTELPGYLVDYTEKFLAVFNVDHTPMKSETIEVTENLEREDLSVMESEHGIVISRKGTEPAVIEKLVKEDTSHEIDAVLLPKTELQIITKLSFPLTLHLHHTQRIDLVCPRSIGTVVNGASNVRAQNRFSKGIAPSIETHNPTA